MTNPRSAPPPTSDASVAREINRALTEHRTDVPVRIEVTSGDGTKVGIPLPAAALKVLADALGQLAKGKDVTVIAVDDELTTQQAADILNVSRPYLVSLIEKGELDARMVGNQRRLLAADVLAYKAAEHLRRSDGLRELAALDQDAGLR